MEEIFNKAPDDSVPRCATKAPTLEWVSSSASPPPVHPPSVSCFLLIVHAASRCAYSPEVERKKRLARAAIYGETSQNVALSRKKCWMHATVRNCFQAVLIFCGAPSVQRWVEMFTEWGGLRATNDIFTVPLRVPTIDHLTPPHDVLPLLLHLPSPCPHSLHQ